jgi:hypothetical protein
MGDRTRPIVVPAQGFQGWAQQTQATQALMPARRAAKKKRKVSRKAAPKKRATAKRRSPAKKRAPARLVKGSAAARAHMAKLRKMRRK